MRKHKIKRKITVSIGMAVLMAALLSLTACQKKSSGDNQEGVKEDSVKDSTAAEMEIDPEADFGDFTSKTVYGTTASTHDIFAQSELTVVNIWSPSCEPCEEEMKVLGTIGRQFAGRGVQMLGIIKGVEEERDPAALEMADKADTDYIHLLDTEELEQELLSQYKELPVTIFVDRNGQIQGEVYTGEVNAQELEAVINERHDSVCIGDHPADSGVG